MYRYYIMQTQSLISIVIPVYNRASIVLRTLECISNQSYRPIDVILVDNGSTDGSYEILQKWKSENESAKLKISLLDCPTKGVCRARNAGLNIVTTPYVMFFDSDDLMAENHLERIAKNIEDNPDADIIGWDIDCVFLGGKRRRLMFGTGDYMYNHIFHASLSTIRYVCKTELMRKAGGWNEQVDGWNDYELGVRIMLLNPLIVYAGKEITVTVLRQEESITGTGFSAHPQRWETSLDFCHKHLLQSEYSHLIKWIETRRAILAGHYTREKHPEEGKRLLNEVLSRQSSRYNRMFFRFIHRFIACGGRGTAILAKIFI